MEKQNPHCEKTIVRTPLVKVLEILKNFFQEVFKWDSGKSPKVFPTYIRWRSERRQAAAIPIPLDGIGRETSGMGRTKPATQNPHCVKPVSRTPLSKVLEMLKNFFQEVFKQGLGRSPKVFLTYIRWRSERRQVAAIPIPLDGIGRETSGMGRIKPATQNPHCEKTIVRTPLVKVLEILKNFFQEVFKQGLGQSPKVFYAL